MSFPGKDAKNMTGMLIAEVKKPGLREAVEKLGTDFKNKDLMIFTPEQLMAAKGDGPNGGLTGKDLVLIRPDFVASSDNLSALQHLNESLDSGGGHFDISAFGQRLERAYQGGAGFLSGLDLHYLVNEVSPKTEKETAALQQSGFGDVKYLIAEHKQVSGQSTNRSEISFNGPRHGVASWLGQPGTMGGLDFVPADSIMAVSLLLKSPAEIFDDVKSLAEASQPGSSQKLDQMQTAFNLNLRDDLLGKLTGEITYAVQDMSGPESAWTIALKTNDPAGLQKTIERLVAFVGMTAGNNGNGPTIGHETENGITYNTVQVPNPQKPMEISYASVDGYLLIGSGKTRVMDAVRLHQSGRSLAKVGGLGALLPQDVHGVSAIVYQTKSPFLKSLLAGLAPGLAQSPVFDQSTPTAVWARGDESAISFGSNNPGFDLGIVSVIAAVAIPNMMHAKRIASEGTAAPAVHKTRPAAAHKPH